MDQLVPTITSDVYRAYLKDHDVTLRLYMPDPELWVIDNFLSTDECEKLISRYQPKTKPMGYVGKDGELVLNEKRKARGNLTDRDDPVDALVNDRLEALTQWSQFKTEPTSFVHYRAGDYIKPHFDFLGDRQRQGPAGQRVGTVIVYLNDTVCEGATYFTHSGLKVYPKRGTLILFNYPKPTLESTSQHGSDEIIQGDKFVLVKWFRSGFVLDTDE